MQDCRDLKSLCFLLLKLSGIINPIEAKQRKGKGAVGAYGSERTTQSLQDFPVVDSEEEAEEVTGSQEVRVGGVCAILVCLFLHLFMRSFIASPHVVIAHYGPVTVVGVGVHGLGPGDRQAVHSQPQGGGKSSGCYEVPRRK